MDSSNFNSWELFSFEETYYMLTNLDTIYNGNYSVYMKDLLLNLHDESYESIKKFIEILMNDYIYKYSIMDILIKLYTVDIINNSSYDPCCLFTTTFIDPMTRESEHYIRYNNRNKYPECTFDHISKYLSEAYSSHYGTIIISNEKELFIQEFKQKYHMLNLDVVDSHRHALTIRNNNNHVYS